MATLLESSAAFDARALEHGLTHDQLQRLKDNGLINLSKLAFAISTPGTSPDDTALKSLLHEDPDMVTVGQLASIRRLMFDAQTLCAAQVKHILAGTESTKKAELVPAERHKESKPSGRGWPEWSSRALWNVHTSPTITWRR